MSDPVLERAAAIQRYADDLEKEVAHEARLFEAGERTLKKMLNDLRSTCSQLLSFFQKVNSESKRQKALPSATQPIDASGFPSHGGILSTPLQTPGHETERWIRFPEKNPAPLQPAAAPASLPQTVNPESRTTEILEFLAQPTSGQWDAHEGADLAKPPERPRAAEGSETEQNTSRERDAG